MRLRRLLLVGALLTSLTPFGAVAPLSALTNTDKVKLAEALNKQPPIEFFIAKGVPNACGPGCDRWIAADGHFDSEAAARLRRLLEKIGKPNLPIYFNSSGGNLTQAMEIGRMMRARGMTAGVALTLAAKCRPEKTADQCARLIRSNLDSDAVIQTDQARCLSACAIAILGAGNRQIAPDALLGVHSALVYIPHPTKGATERQLDHVAEQATQILVKRLANYVTEMKLSRELINIMSNTRFEDVHYLTRAELFDLGIDRREPVETGWHFGYQAIPAVGSAAFVNLRAGDGAAAADQKRMTLIFSCDARRSLFLTSLRPLRNSSAQPVTDLRVSAGPQNITLKFGSSFLTSYRNETFEVRQERVLAQLWIETFMKAPAIAIAEQPAAALRQPGQTSEASGVEYSVPSTGVSDVFKTFAAHCAAPQPTVPLSVIVPPSEQNVLSSNGKGQDAGWRYAFLPVAALGSSAFAETGTSVSDQLLLAISCGSGGTFTISTVQRMAKSSSTPRFDIVVGEEALGLNLWATGSVLTTWKGAPYDFRQFKWPRPVVERLVASPKIAVIEKPRVAEIDADPDNAREATQFSIPTKGLQNAFKSLSDHCAIVN